MLKRFLVIALGAACGILLASAVMHLQLAWSLWPNRGLARNTAYFRTVLDLVETNCADEKDANYDVSPGRRWTEWSSRWIHIPSSCGPMRIASCRRRWAGISAALASRSSSVAAR